jgi:hypothetical protein
VVIARLLLLVAAAATACSGKPRPDGAGSSGPPGSGASGGSSGSADSAGSAAASAGSAGSAASTASKLGEVQLHVEWPDVPAAARSSPGRTPCNTPHAASVAPTPTWGIPDAIVIVDGAPAAAAESHVVLADCALSPRAAVGASLVVESAADRPASVTLSKRGELSKPESIAPGAAAPRLLRLPIAGHAVSISLDPGGVYELATADKDPETAWLASPPSGATAVVTDASGQAVLRDLSPGPHAVTAWLPPRAGQPARLARGTVTVAPGQLAELTLQLAPIAPPK